MKTRHFPLVAFLSGAALAIAGCGDTVIKGDDAAAGDAGTAGATGGAGSGGMAGRAPDAGPDAAAADAPVAGTGALADAGADARADANADAPVEAPAPTPVVWAVDVTNKLVSFDATSPGTLASSVAVTGLAADETIVGITFRAVNGDLIALGSSNRLYAIAKATGVATPIGAGAFAPVLAGTGFGVDFNPVVDRIRVVSDQEQNVRLHPTLGTVVDFDAVADGVQTDPALNPAGNVVAVAYTSDQAPPAAATKTTLYAIDSASDQLVRQGGADGTPSPNTGILTPIGPLGVDTASTVGFDIEPVTSKAYASLTVAGTSRLYVINLATGAATAVGPIAGGAIIRAIALSTSAPTLYARLGRSAGIRTVVNDFVGRVVGDPKINGYFLNGNVSGTRLTDCLVLQLGALTGGPETYPSMGCRSMKASHQDLNLKISTKDFDDLAGHLVAALQAATVSAGDVGLIVNAVTPLAGDIVQDSTSNATVYQRVGRKPAIQGVIDQFIAKVVADVRIKDFFTSVNGGRLKTCLVRQVCGIDGPCKYGNEVDGEPGVSRANPCRSMKASHENISTPRRITITDFNALVEDLVMVLDEAAVPAADKNAILGALGPMCRDIVDNGTGCPQ